MEQIKVELLKISTTDDELCDFVRVSTGRKGRENGKLIEEVLIPQDHEPCFEHIVTWWRIREPQRIQVQGLRTRLASHNAASARYGYVFDELYSFHFQALDEGLLEDVALSHIMEELYISASKCLRLYNDLDQLTIGNRHRKRLRELASFALPQGVMTERIFKVDFASLRRFLRRRLDSHAQPEIQEVARQMRELLDGRPEIEHSLKFLPTIGE